ncbi:hypothetical protein B566_EDAN016664 [Ephemera danica]|nr:hypothetical protein B566_EDAN016664 [Ephemera danica]
MFPINQRQGALLPADPVSSAHNNDYGMQYTRYSVQNEDKTSAHHSANDSKSSQTRTWQRRCGPRSSQHKFLATTFSPHRIIWNTARKRHLHSERESHLVNIRRVGWRQLSTRHHPTRRHKTKNRLKGECIGENCSSALFEIQAGVPQGSFLDLVLFNLFINQVLSSDETELAVYADDTAAIASSLHQDIAMRNLQDHTNCKGTSATNEN